jgi:hypothetical protein
MTDTRPTQLAADIISGVRGFRVTISPEHAAAIAIARLVEQVRQEERARCAGIVKTAWIDGGLDVTIDADAAQQLCERASQAIHGESA